MTSVILKTPLLIVLFVLFLFSFALPLFIKKIPDLFSLTAFLFLTAFLIASFVLGVTLNEMVIALLIMAIVAALLMLLKRKVVKS